jgi:hypothetical protein
MGNLFAFGDLFSAHLLLSPSEKPVNMGISCHFRIGSGFAITQVIKTS